MNPTSLSKTMLKPYPVDTTKQYVNLLLYGPPGAGKTSLAATAQDHPQMKNILFLNIEGGLLSVASKPGISAIDIKSVDQMEEVFWAMVGRTPGYESFQTVVIDSGSELQTVNLESIATKQFEENKGKRDSIDTLFQEDYGKDTARLKRVFRWFRDAPFHVVITALRKEVYKKGTSREAPPVLLDVVPAFTDKLGQAVRGYCDFVWYLDRDPESGARKLLTDDTGVFRAKTRGQNFSQAIGKVVERPNLAELYDRLLKTEGTQIKEAVHA